MGRIRVRGVVIAAVAMLAARSSAWGAPPPPPPPQVAVLGLLPAGAGDPAREAIEEAVADGLRAYTTALGADGVRTSLSGDVALGKRLAEGKKLLARGIALFKKVDTVGAIGVLRKAEIELRAARAEHYEPAPLVQLYMYLGASYVSESDADAAAGALKELLRVDPAPVLPKGYFAPDVAAALDRARKARAGAAPDLPESASVDEVLRVMAVDAVACALRERSGAGVRVVVYLLRPGLAPVKGWATVVPGDDGRDAARLAAGRAAAALGLVPASADGAAATDGGAAGTGAGAGAGTSAGAGAGAGASAAGKARPVTKRWWFWTAIVGGALVVGGGAGLTVYFLTR